MRGFYLRLCLLNVDIPKTKALFSFSDTLNKKDFSDSSQSDSIFLDLSILSPLMKKFRKITVNLQPKLKFV